MKIHLAIILTFFFVSAYLQTTCSNIPPDNVYYLTQFCDQVTACGIKCGNCLSYYAADSQRFKCKSTISCTRSGKSANLQVIDEGPSCALQKKAGKPIIDASLSACKLFTGQNSCGYEDKFAITCKKIASPSLSGKIPLGECTWDPQNKKLPFCHLQINRGKYTFENIEQWLTSYELNEQIEIITS